MPAEILLSVAMAIIAAWGIPAIGMRLLVPALRDSRLSLENYRGRKVFLGLGIVWVFWALGATLIALVWPTIALPSGLLVFGAGLHSASIVVTTVVWAFVLGLIDDFYGTSDSKGFKGHLAALARGALTTGALKAFGIGFVAFVAGVGIAEHQGLEGAGYAVKVALSALTIALCANLINLLDLRPGRALKGYGVLGLAAAVALAVPMTDGVMMGAGSLIVAFIWLTGPALAVARFDLAEEGMLGDAGANAAGALVGSVLSIGLSTPALSALAVFLLMANALSERVSFSRIIESNVILSRFDSWGRK